MPRRRHYPVQCKGSSSPKRLLWRFALSASSRHPNGRCCRPPEISPPAERLYLATPTQKASKRAQLRPRADLIVTAMFFSHREICRPSPCPPYSATKMPRHRASPRSRWLKGSVAEFRFCSGRSRFTGSLRRRTWASGAPSTLHLRRQGCPPNCVMGTRYTGGSRGRWD